MKVSQSMLHREEVRYESYEATQHRRNAKDIYIYIRIYIYIKVKWSHYRQGVAQRVGRVIALLFHDRGATRGWGVSSTSRPHFTPGKDPAPIVQEAGWAPGPVRTDGKSRPTGIWSQTVQPVISRCTDWITWPIYIYIYNFRLNWHSRTDI